MEKIFRKLDIFDATIKSVIRVRFPTTGSGYATVRQSPLPVPSELILYAQSAAFQSQFHETSLYSTHKRSSDENFRLELID